MLTPDSIRRHYFGPRISGKELRWRWHRRGWSYPRRTYVLQYSPNSRMFHLVATVKTSRRAEIMLVNLEPGEVDVFRTLLSPADLARCAAASIALSSRRDTDA